MQRLKRLRTLFPATLPATALISAKQHIEKRSTKRRARAQGRAGSSARERHEAKKRLLFLTRLFLRLRLRVARAVRHFPVMLEGQPLIDEIYMLGNID